MFMVILQSTNGLTFINGIAGVLLSMAPYMALGCMVAAGVALRGEGGTNFSIGGGFGKYIMWAVIFAALRSLPTLMNAMGVPGITLANGTSDEFSGMTGAATFFVQTYIVGKLVPSIAGFLVLKAVLDSGEGNSPLPSLVSAIFLLSVNGLWTLATGWTAGTDAYSVATGLSSALAYMGGTVCPICAAFCFIGAVVTFIKGGKWGHLVLTGLALLCFTGIWALVKSWG